ARRRAETASLHTSRSCRAFTCGGAAAGCSCSISSPRPDIGASWRASSDGGRAALKISEATTEVQPRQPLAEAAAAIQELGRDPNGCDGSLRGGAVGSRGLVIVEQHAARRLAPDIEEPDAPAIGRAVGVQTLRLGEDVLRLAGEGGRELDVEALARVPVEDGVGDARYLEIRAGGDRRDEVVD